MDLLTIPFMRHIVIAGLLVAIGLGPLSVYIVLRRIVFVGAAVAEISSAGVALAILLGLEPFGVALVLTILTLLAFSKAADSPRVPLEALIGLIYAAGSAMAVLLIVKAPRGEASILNVLFGNILTVPPALLWAMVPTFAILGAIQYFAHKEFLIVAYDPDMARSLGIRVNFWNTIFYVTVGVAIAIAIRAVGALLTFALLVAPGATALCLSDRLSRAFGLATIVSVTATLAGICTSYWLDLPTGATIVSFLAAMFSLGYVYALLNPSER